MNGITLEERVAALPPRLTAKEHNAFPNGRWGGANGERPTSNVQRPNLEIDYSFSSPTARAESVVAMPTEGLASRKQPLTDLVNSSAAAGNEACSGTGAVMRSSETITPPPGFLAPEEVLELNFCERSIERGLETFLEVGIALSTIRDQKLYRGTFATFEDYCQQRWEIKSSRARQLCAAAAVIGNLKSEIGSQRSERMPTSERQVRPLMSLEPEKQCEVWREAVATAPGGKVTSKHVVATADRLAGREARGNGRSVKPIEAGSRQEQLRALAEQAINKVREMIDVHGTADSEAAANVVVGLSYLETFKDHLGRMGQMQEARS